MSQDPTRPEDAEPQWEPAEPGTEAPAGPPPGRRRNRRKILAGIILGVLAMVGLAFAAVTLFNAFAGTEDILAAKVPARSAFYVTGYLDPGAGQKVNLKNLAGKFPVLQGRDLGQTVEQGLDVLAAQGGLSFSGDIKPWLGSQIALAFEPPTGPEPGLALLVASKDDGRARTAMSKVEQSPQFGGGASWRSDPYRGVDVRVGESAPGVSDRAYAIVDNTVIVSTEVDVVHEIIDTMQGRAPSLADDPTYQDTIGGLPKSVLGLAYVNLKSLVDLLAGFMGSQHTSGSVAAPSPTAVAASSLNQAADPFAQLRAFKGLGISLSAQEAGFALDFTVDIDQDQLTPQQQALLSAAQSPRGALESVPGRAYGVVALGGFKEIVQALLAQAPQNPQFESVAKLLDLKGVVEHLSGEAAVEVGPGPTRLPAGAALIGTDDPAGMQRFLDNAARLLVESSTPGGPTGFQTQDYKGVTIHVATVPSLQSSGLNPSYAVANGLGILATSPDEVKAVIDAHEGSNITGAPTFKDAESQVPQGTQLAYADVQAILQALRPELSSIFGSQFTLVEPNLRPMKALIITGETGGHILASHLFVLIR